MKNQHMLKKFFLWIPTILCISFLLYLPLHYYRYMGKYKSVRYYKNIFTQSESEEIKAELQIAQNSDCEILGALLTPELFLIEIESSGTLEEIWGNLFELHDLPSDELSYRGDLEWENIAGEAVQTMEFVPYRYNHDFKISLRVYVWKSNHNYRIAICDLNDHHSGKIWNMFQTGEETE